MKEKIYDFFEMYDEQRECCIVRIKDDYFIFDELDIANDGKIHAQKIGDEKYIYVLSQNIFEGKTNYYIIEEVYPYMR